MNINKKSKRVIKRLGVIMLHKILVSLLCLSTVALTQTAMVAAPQQVTRRVTIVNNTMHNILIAGIHTVQARTQQEIELVFGLTPQVSIPWSITGHTIGRQRQQAMHAQHARVQPIIGQAHALEDVRRMHSDDSYTRHTSGFILLSQHDAQYITKITLNSTSIPAGRCTILNPQAEYEITCLIETSWWGRFKQNTTIVSQNFLRGLTFGWRPQRLAVTPTTHTELADTSKIAGRIVTGALALMFVLKMRSFFTKTPQVQQPYLNQAID